LTGYCFEIWNSTMQSSVLIRKDYPAWCILRLEVIEHFIPGLPRIRDWANRSEGIHPQYARRCSTMIFCHTLNKNLVTPIGYIHTTGGKRHRMFHDPSSLRGY